MIPAMEDSFETAGNMMLGGGFLSGAGKAVPGALGANMWHGGPHKWAPEPGFPEGRPAAVDTYIPPVSTVGSTVVTGNAGNFGGGYYAPAVGAVPVIVETGVVYPRSYRRRSRRSTSTLLCCCSHRQQ